MSLPRLQLAFRVPPSPLRVAGIPAPLRAARSVAMHPDVERVIFVGAPEDLLEAFAFVLRQIPTYAPHRSVELATVEVAGDGIPDASALVRFGQSCASAGGLAPTAFTWRDAPIAVYLPAGRPSSGSWPPAEMASAIRAPESAWTPVRDAGEVRAAEASLLASLGKPTDGFLSRFDRRISTFLSRRLIATPVTPNQITWVSIVVGLLGALAVASTHVAICLAGTLIVWLSAILDGCDGEIARAKLMSSEAGARLDLFGDHVVNFAVLAAIAANVYQTRPEGFLPAALLLGLGVLASAWTVARLTSRQPKGAARKGSVDLAVERLASRDFIYLVIPLAAIRRLDWFFWGAAVGSNLFWMALWALSGRRRFGNGEGREHEHEHVHDPEQASAAERARGAP